MCADRGDHVGDFSTAGGDLIGWADYLYPNSLAVDDECGHRSGGPRSVKADLDAAQTPAVLIGWRAPETASTELPFVARLTASVWEREFVGSSTECVGVDAHGDGAIGQRHTWERIGRAMLVGSETTVDIPARRCGEGDRFGHGHPVSGAGWIFGGDSGIDGGHDHGPEHPHRQDREGVWKDSCVESEEAVIRWWTSSV
ncbi:hypothetical protein ACETU7_04500 [Rhodococcus sp. 3Y1]